MQFKKKSKGTTFVFVPKILKNVIYDCIIEFLQKIENGYVLDVKRKTFEFYTQKKILKSFKSLIILKFQKKSKGTTFVFVQKIGENVIY